MSKLFSRKLWMTLAGVVGVLLADFSATGTVHAETITAAAAMVTAYALAQGWVDGKGAAKALLVPVMLLGVMAMAGCKSKDPLTEQNLQRAWEVWGQDRRPSLPDAEYEALSDEQKKLYLPESLVPAREFERDNALKYEATK